MKVNYSIVCIGVSVNPENQAISFHELLEIINCHQLPMVMWPFCVVFDLSKEKHDKDTIDTDFVIKNNGKVLGSMPSPVSFPNGDKTRLITKIPRLEIPKAGVLEFELLCNRKAIGVAMLKIVKHG